jgi:putative ABC transport system permease protein
MEASLPPATPLPMTQVTGQAVGTYAFFASILGVFGTIALLLAAFGIYGLVSYSARQSAHEIAIRIAIGARRGDVMCRFLGSGLRLGVWGAVTGVFVALVLTRLLSALLYGVSPTDAIAFGAAPAAVLLIVLLASLVPAWRASRTDPSAALRHR